jgi:haloalkane dehalogenase
LSDDEMAQYRQPYTEPGEARRPTLTWPREIPIEGEPAEIAKLVTDYGRWLSTAPFPKLFINGEPGAILTGAHRDFCRTWVNQTEVTVDGIHFLQEDSPDQIGEALADWYRHNVGPGSV